MKTTLAKKETRTPKWYLVDAKGQVLGRLAVKIANLLRGRTHALYTPHVDTGDFVVVINASEVVLTGNKEATKSYMFYSGHPGGERYSSFISERQRDPEFVVQHAVKGMLPKNRLARHMLTKLKVFGGAEHTHAAQNPQLIKL